MVYLFTTASVLAENCVDEVGSLQSNEVSKTALENEETFFSPKKME